MEIDVNCNSFSEEQIHYISKAIDEDIVLSKADKAILKVLITLYENKEIKILRLDLISVKINVPINTVYSVLRSLKTKNYIDQFKKNIRIYSLKIENLNILIKQYEKNKKIMEKLERTMELNKN